MVDQPTLGDWKVQPLQADHGASIAIVANAQVIAIIPPPNEDEDPDASTASRGPDDLANAAFIVLACNSHQKLLKLLEMCVEDSLWRLEEMQIDAKNGYAKKDDIRCQERLVQQAEAAITEARRQA